MKKYLLMAVSFVLVAALAVVGTLAYLQFETPTDVNVMTVGNVKIAQHEYERVVDENGNWVSTGDVDKYGYTPDELQEYTQAKPLYPAVFADGQIKWDDRNNGTYQQSWAQVGAPGSIQLFDDSVKNVIDKFVFVENTGKTDAYARSIFAFEQGGVTAERFDEIIGTNGDSDHWAWETVATDVVIDGCEYVLVSATYVGATSNPNGILAAGKVSYPSLLQVYLAPEATNEDVEALDGNGNGTYDILVISQAVQAKGFDDAVTALDAAFGEITVNNHPWVNGVEIPVVVSNDEELAAAIAEGGVIYLSNGTYTLPANLSNVELIANGDEVNVAVPAVDANAVTTLGNNVTVSGINFDVDGSTSADTAVLLIKGENVTVENCAFDISGTNYSAIALGGSTNNTNIVNCDFVGGYKHIGPASGTPGTTVIDGCTFSGSNSTYAIHINTTKSDLTVKNCEIALFNTFFGQGNDAGKLVFENCDFVVEAGKTNVVKLYRDADFINCDFEDGFLFSDASNWKDIAVTFEGGSYGEGTIKEHFLADEFANNVTATFDGDEWYWDTTENEWIDR